MAALIDAFPLLRYIPEAILPIKKRAKQLHEKERDLYVGHWLNVKKAIKSGTAKVSLMISISKSGRRDPSSKFFVIALH